MILKKIENKKLFIAAYVRVSTEEQKLHGLSVTDQEAAISQWASNRGLNIVKIYNDAGYSARKPYNKRPAMVQLIEDIRSKKVNFVVFTRLDRWFRSLPEYYKVQSILDENGVSWQAILEDYETVTASGRLKVNIMLSVAQDEADRTSERIKFTFEQKRARGESTNGRCPFGYKIVNGRPEIDTGTSEAALDMFHHFIWSRSVVSVTKHMRETWGIIRAYKNFRLYLQNPMYIGKFYDSDCPALIPLETWSLTQQILQTRAQRNMRTGGIYLFTGILKCAECGRNMSGEVIKKGGKNYIYYRCPKKYRGEGCTHIKRVREDKLEEWLLTNLVSIVEVHNLKVQKEKIKEKAPDAPKIKRKMEKLKDLYLSDLIDRDIYERDYLALKRELESSEQEVIETPIDVDALKTGLSMYQGLNRIGKKEFWSRTIQKIVTNNDGDFFVDLI